MGKPNAAAKGKEIQAPASIALNAVVLEQRVPTEVRRERARLSKRARSLPGHGVTGTPAGICAYQFRTGSPGALSSGGCGLANPIVPGCALLLTCFSPSIVVMKAASIATLSTIAKMTMTAARACRSAASFFMTSPPWRKENDARRLGLPTQALGAGT